MSQQILIAEDDEDIVELLSLYLTGEGFTVFSAGNGLQALERVEVERIDVAILDIMLPVLNGYDLLRKIREKHNFPVIILSAKDLDTDRILGLNLGADAYLTKPFNPLEVVAYVKSALRRYYELGGNAAAEKSAVEKTTLTVGELELDLLKFILRRRGQIVPLTPAELKIVLKLMQSPGRVYTKAQLYACIGGELYESDDNTMMVHISNIRAKIEDDPSNPRYIKTVRGLGYKIEEH
ncbi:MAG: response regulator transcription factor [Oscillospiraceae bacterium]|jgi:DNA-binding response OmpR family regulator|nr:response regulator transcription factor [Oscillospiraceae bacterium]